MTSRYPPSPRRPQHARSARYTQEPNEAHSSPVSPPAVPLRSPRERRELWNTRERDQIETTDPGPSRGVREPRHYRDPEDPSDYLNYLDSRHHQRPQDLPEYRGPQVTPRDYRAPGEHAGHRPTREPQPRETPVYRDPHASQEFGVRMDPRGHRDPRELRNPRDSQEFGAVHRPRDPRDSQEFGAVRGPRDPRDSQEFGAVRGPRDPRDSQEFAELRGGRDYPTSGEPHDSYESLNPRDHAGGADPYGQHPWREQDDLPLFGDSRDSGRAGNRRAKRVGRDRSRIRRRRRKRVLGVLIVLALLAGLGAGAWFGWQEVRGIGDVPDYAGTGEADVIAHVADGASTSDIAAELARLDVVASGKAFVNAAHDNTQIRSVQPGYYRMRTKMSGVSAVTMLLEPTSKVGHLEIRGGMQLDDVKLPDGKVIPGILSLISTASMAELNGASTQIPPDQLRQAMETTDPAALGVPDWAISGVRAAEPQRRLEGLIVPGTYHVKPGSSAVELLKSIMDASALSLQATALTDASKNTGFQPYELLTIASLVEKEGITGDFGKVSRVIYNRLANQQRLQLDSTINYPLDRQEVRTTDNDRLRPGPYNSYMNTGLPPTPIGSPSAKAIAAAVEPTPGAWRYFVKCQSDGTSCFAETMEQHQANINDARARGVF